MNIFIDTNILLDFYRLSKGDLEELRKIAKLSETKKIRLFISDYLKDEVYRNREAVIARSVADFIDKPIELPLPNMFKAYPEYGTISRLLKELKKAKGALLEAVERDIRKSALIADSVIADLFLSTETIPVPEQTMRLGIDRTHHGKPPGKRGSCGDSVHWEWLLLAVPKKEDLSIISNDRDYESPLQADKLSAYLGEEWRLKKASKCTLHSSLSSFLKEHFPNIKISEDIDKVPGTETKAQHDFYSLAQQMTNAARDYLSINRTEEMLRALASSPLQKAIEAAASNPLQKLLETLADNPLQQALRDMETPLQKALREALPITSKSKSEASDKKK